MIRILKIAVLVGVILAVGFMMGGPLALVEMLPQLLPSLVALMILDFLFLGGLLTMSVVGLFKVMSLTSKGVERLVENNKHRTGCSNTSDKEVDHVLS